MITYTVIGGIKAVTWSDVQQMCVIFLGLVLALVTVVRAAAVVGLVRRRGVPGGRGGTPERGRPPTSTGTTATTSGAACSAARFCSCRISAATSRRCSAI